MKITTVFIQSVLLINIGIRTLFSIVFIKAAIPTIIKPHRIPNHVSQAIIAGMLQTSCHTYGIISNNPNIRANDNLFGMLIPNNSKIHSDKYKVTAIYNANNNLDLSQIHNFLYIFSNFMYMYLYFFSPHKLAINFITDIFSIENNTESVTTIKVFVRNVANPVTNVTAKLPRVWA